ncbi:amidohydrolase [Niallia nealsonii]|uniref:Amidohydrolase n=1 Tax=Niallia nealsonii TaxID=115979 RepID=A0A2N0Z2S1_9BACI|nr:amidohydrolase [Niallia nealsonii]PKG23800.1 amidohydrolase [Niallia nealsonii]
MNVIEQRRDFHRYPEQGFLEFRTASIVAQTLKKLGFEVLCGKEAMVPEARFGVPQEEQLTKAYHQALKQGADPLLLKRMQGGNTAVVGIWRGGEQKSPIAFRFDMDALPIKESEEEGHLPFKEGYASCMTGSMHACGHDGHTAIGLTFAEKIAEAAPSQTIKLIFQPAEEGGRGAVSMVEKGILDDVRHLFCLHLGLNLPLGEVHGGISNFLATSKLKVIFKGIPSHAGASPEKGANALLAASTALLNIHALPRFSGEKTRINVGVLEGGTAANIIPAYAQMILETRAESWEVNEELKKRVEKIIVGSGAMHGVQTKMEVIGEATTAASNPELMELVVEEAKKVQGFTKFQLESNSNLGSEDATFMMRRVQEYGGKATYMIIGSPLPAPHHHHRFDIDEKVLPMSVELLTRIAKSVCNH